MTREPLSSLQALANQLRIQLLELPEYRALTVIDRTILELSEILSRPATSPANPVAAPASIDESTGGSSPPSAGVPLRAKLAPLGAGSSQSRMAMAIAETIAGRTAPSAASETARRPSQTLRAAV